MLLGTPTSGSKEERLQVIQHSMPLELSSFPAHQLGEIVWHSLLQESQFLSFLLHDALHGSYHMKITFYLQRKIGHTWMPTFPLILHLIGKSKNDSTEVWGWRLSLIKKEQTPKGLHLENKGRLRGIANSAFHDMSSSHKSAFIKLKADWIIIIFIDFLICETSFE